MYRGNRWDEPNGAHREHNYRWIYRATGSAGSLALAYHNAPRAWTGSDRATLTQNVKCDEIPGYRRHASDCFAIDLPIGRSARSFLRRYLHALSLKSTGLDLFREFCSCCFAQLKNFSFRRPLTTRSFKLFQKSFPRYFSDIEAWKDEIDKLNDKVIS